MKQHLRKQHEGEEEKPRKRTRRSPAKKSQKRNGSKKAQKK
jgi:hypothetical protein